MRPIIAVVFSFIITLVLGSVLHASMYFTVEGEKSPDGKGFKINKKTIINFQITEQSSIEPGKIPETIILYEDGNTYLKNGVFFISDKGEIYLKPGSSVIFEGLPPNVIISIGEQKFEAEKLKNRKIKIMLKKAEILLK